MGSYVLPNDEVEQDRLDLVHCLWGMLFVDGMVLDNGGDRDRVLKDRLFKAPLKNPQRILDIGCGTGIWAIEMGE